MSDSKPSRESVILDQKIQKVELALKAMERAIAEHAKAKRELEQYFDQMEKKHGPKARRRWTSKTLLGAR